MTPGPPPTRPATRQPCGHSRSGTGTTGDAARKLGRRYVGIDLNREYLDMQVVRFAQGVLL